MSSKTKSMSWDSPFLWLGSAGAGHDPGNGGRPAGRGHCAARERSLRLQAQSRHNGRRSRDYLLQVKLSIFLVSKGLRQRFRFVFIWYGSGSNPDRGFFDQNLKKKLQLKKYLWGGIKIYNGRCQFWYLLWSGGLSAKWDMFFLFFFHKYHLYQRC